MLRPCLFVGFTGHRKLPNPALIADAIRAVLARVGTRASVPLVAVSSAASGADTLFAQAALEAGLPWQALLPLPREEFRNDFSATEWETTEQLLGRAATVAVEPPTETRDEAYLECGLRTVDESDVLIAVWNGQPAAGLGGTGDIVSYARKIGRPLLWIHSVSGEVVEERLDAMPKSEPGDAAVPPTGGRAGVELAFRAAARAAKEFAPEARRLAVTVILLNLMASGAAAVAAGLGAAPAYMIGARIFMVSLLVASVWIVVRQRQARASWVSARVSVEICRSALATWSLPHPGLTFPKVRLAGFGALQRSLRLARLSDSAAATDFATVRQHYLEKRVLDQRAYFERQLAHAQPLFRWLRGGALAATNGAIALGITALALAAAGVSGPILYSVRTLSFVLPLLNAAFLSYVVANDLGRRVSRYRDMIQTLDASALRLEQVHSWGGLERVVTETEEELLQEVQEWHSVSRFGK